MAPMTSVDERRLFVSPLPARVGNEPNDVAAAILRELRHRFPDAIVSYGLGGAGLEVPAGMPELRVVGRQPVLVSGTSSRRRQAVVAAAVDDDGNAGAIVQYAASPCVPSTSGPEAERLRVHGCAGTNGCRTPIVC